MHWASQNPRNHKFILVPGVLIRTPWLPYRRKLGLKSLPTVKSDNQGYIRNILVFFQRSYSIYSLLAIESGDDSQRSALECHVPTSWLLRRAMGPISPSAKGLQQMPKKGPYTSHGSFSWQPAQKHSHHSPKKPCLHSPNITTSNNKPCLHSANLTKNLES